MGIERQEPYVVRKDVERRVAELRKTLEDTAGNDSNDGTGARSEA